MTGSHPQQPEIATTVPTGTVTKAINGQSRGRVKYQGTEWPAKLCSESSEVSIAPDVEVAIVGREGITLVVKLEC